MRGESPVPLKFQEGSEDITVRTSIQVRSTWVITPDYHKEADKPRPWEHCVRPILQRSVPSACWLESSCVHPRLAGPGEDRLYEAEDVWVWSWGTVAKHEWGRQGSFIKIMTSIKWMPTTDLGNTDQKTVVLEGCVRTMLTELGFNAILEIITLTSTE